MGAIQNAVNQAMHVAGLLYKVSGHNKDIIENNQVNLSKRITSHDSIKAKDANMNMSKRVIAINEQKQSVANYMKLLKEDNNG